MSAVIPEHIKQFSWDDKPGLTTIIHRPCIVNAYDLMALMRKLWGAFNSAKTAMAVASMQSAKLLWSTASKGRCFLCTSISVPSTRKAPPKNRCWVPGGSRTLMPMKSTRPVGQNSSISCESRSTRKIEVMDNPLFHVQIHTKLLIWLPCSLASKPLEQLCCLVWAWKIWAWEIWESDARLAMYYVFWNSSLRRQTGWSLLDCTSQ